jgi:hypothetical protein
VFSGTLTTSLVPIVIQSRATDGVVWRNEVWRRNRFTAYMTARAKARVTGRVYRLVDQDGAVLEQVRAHPRAWPQSDDAQPPGTH